MGRNPNFIGRDGRAPHKEADLKTSLSSKVVVELEALRSLIKPYIGMCPCSNAHCSEKISELEVNTAQLGASITFTCPSGHRAIRYLGNMRNGGRQLELNFDFQLCATALSPSYAGATDYLRKFGLNVPELRTDMFYKQVLPLARETARELLATNIQAQIVASIRKAKRTASLTDGKLLVRIVLSSDGQYSLTQGAGCPKQATVIIIDVNTGSIVALEIVEFHDGYKPLTVWELKAEVAKKRSSKRLRPFALEQPAQTHFYTAKTYSNLEFIATWRCLDKIWSSFNFSAEVDEIYVTINIENNHSGLRYLLVILSNRSILFLGHHRRMSNDFIYLHIRRRKNHLGA